MVNEQKSSPSQKELEAKKDTQQKTTDDKGKDKKEQEEELVSYSVLDGGCRRLLFIVV